MKISEATGKVFARLSGWQVKVAQPTPAKCLIIGAYHTSNWDLPLTILLKLKTGLPIHFVAKKSLFWGPFNRIMYKLGGIPLDRKTSNDFVNTISESYKGKETWMVAILPEGTRNHSSYWRSGFYHIASGAEVPIVFGYADYRRKVVGLGPILQPTGDIEKDFLIIQDFYDTITPAYPSKKGPVRLKPREEQESHA